MVATRRKLERQAEREKAKATTITVALGDLVSSRFALQNISVLYWPVNISFQILKIMHAVDAELKLYDTQRKALLERIGYLPEGETAYQFDPPEKQQEFEDEDKKLLAIEVEMHIAPLKTSNLLGAKNINIAPADLFVLDWLLTD